MVNVEQIKSDLELLKTSQVTKGGISTDPLLQGVKVDRTGKLSKLTTFDGASSTTLIDRDWGDAIPEGGFVLPNAFSQLLTRLDKNTEIEIVHTKKGQLEVKQNKSKWKFPMSLDCSAFSSVGDRIINGDIISTAFSIDGDLLREALLNVFPSLGKDYSTLCSAQIILSPLTREFTAIATDLKRSTVWKADNFNYPALPLPEYSLILPGNKLLPLSKFLKNCDKIEVLFTNSIAVFNCKDKNNSLSLRLIDSEKYPPVRKLFELPLEAGYNVNPKEFLDSLKRIKVLLPDSKLALDNTLDLRIEDENILISHKSDLFTENVACKVLELEGVTAPKLFQGRLNLDYLKGALSLLSGSNCEMKLHSTLCAIASTTLGGTITHFIATVSKQEETK
jgi:DNA polymerase III sliding clamp (beta) subunit (PCNA family)